MQQNCGWPCWNLAALPMDWFQHCLMPSHLHEQLGRQMRMALQAVPVQDLLPAVPYSRCCPQVQAIPASMTSSEHHLQQITGLSVQDMLSIFEACAIKGQVVQSCIRSASPSVNSNYASMGTSVHWPCQPANGATLSYLFISRWRHRGSRGHGGCGWQCMTGCCFGKPGSGS